MLNTLHILIISLSIAFASVNAQHVDTVFHHIYTVGEMATLDLDFEHAEIILQNSESDSVIIETRVKLIPANYETPFAEIEEKTTQKDSLRIFSTVKVSEEIQPHNELKIISYISLPNTTKLTLKTRYSQTFLQGTTGLINANLDYSSFTAGPMPADTNHIFKAKYSEITFNELNNTLSIEGLSTKLNAKHIKKLVSNTQFSEYNIAQINTLLATSYTDKVKIQKADSVHIKGEYSSCIIDQLSQFLQAEMSYGALAVNNISSDFQTVNIANSYVNTKLTFSTESHFSINTDMRYCKLVQDKIELSKITSPTGDLQKGIWGKLTLSEANVSIISSFGDVHLDFK